MKKRTAFIFVLLSAFLTSCGITTNDTSSTRKVVLSSEETSEDTSERDHSHDHSDTSESEETSSEDSSVAVDPCANGHALLHYAPVAPTCLENGYEEGWFCEICGRSFSTQPEGTVEESSGNSGKRVAPLGHSFPEDWTVIQVEDCTHDGIKEKKCVRCDEIERLVTKTSGHNWDGNEVITYDWDFVNRKVTATKKRNCNVEGELVLETKTVGFAKEEVISEANCVNDGITRYTSASFGANSSFSVQTTEVKIDKHHTLKKHNAVVSTCVTHGNNVYYECIGGCDKFFSDPLAEHEIAESSIPLALDPNNHIRTESQLAVEATCSHVGYNAHEVCTACGAKIGYIETPKLDHTPSTKWYSNSSGHYHICTKCNEILTDTLVAHTGGEVGADGSQYCTVCGYEMVPPTEHVCADRVALVNAVPSTCETKGHVQYYECTCGKKYYDLAATELVSNEDDLILDYVSHNATHVEAVAANCNMPGNIEYWHCNVCGKYFSDAACTTQITQSSTVIAKEDHNYSEAWTKDATFHWHACTKCGAPEEKIPHTFNLDHATEDENKYCTICGYIVETATGHLCKLHLVTHDAQDPSCEAAGNTLYYECSEDHKYYSDSNAENEIAFNSWVISALGHNHDGYMPIDEATCTEDGTEEYWYCTTCGQKFTKVADEYVKIATPTVIPAHHTYEYVEATPDTCSTHGIVAHYECSVCHKLFSKVAEEYVEKTLEELTSSTYNPTNHSATLEHHSAQAATCLVDGNLEYWYCPGCHGYFKNAAGSEAYGANEWVVSKSTVDHSPDSEWHTNKDNHWHICTVCGEEVNVVSHTPSATQGDGSVYCTVCGYLITPASEHEHLLVPHSATAPTCTEPGNNLYYSCSSCNKYFSDSEGNDEININSWVIAATGHSYGSVIPSIPSTCTADGMKEHYECSSCHHIFIKENDNYIEVSAEDLVNPAHHTYEHVDAVVDTCTTHGIAEHYECSECHKYFTTEYVETNLEALTSSTYDPNNHNGHLERVNAKDATCGEEGNITYWHCTECGKCYSDASATTEITLESTKIAKLTSHTYTSTWTKTKDPTCTEPGTEERVCSVCGHIDQREIAALGHNTEHVVRKNETCTEPGNIEYWHCSTCGKYYSDKACTTEITAAQTVISPLGHDFDEEPGLIWNQDQTRVVTGFICGRDLSHIDIADNTAVHETTNTYLPVEYYDTTYSPLSANPGKEKLYGDINYHYSFSNGRSYSDEQHVRFTHTGEYSENAEKLFMFKFDDSYTYGGGLSNSSGTSYVVFYSNMTYSCDSDSNSFVASGTTITSNYGKEDAEFWKDYFEFTKDCDLVINMTFGSDNKTVTITVTYYTRIAEYHRYLGYKQTFKSVRKSEFTDSYFSTWRTYVLSYRFARLPGTNSDIQIESCTHGQYVDKDIVSFTNTGTKKTTIVDIDTSKDGSISG